MAARIANPKALYDKALTHTVSRIPNNRGALQFKVTSGGSGKPYVVELVERHAGRPVFRQVSGTCTCRWGQYRTSSTGFVSGCSHVIAAIRFYLMDTYGLTISAWGDIEDATRQKKYTFRSGNGLAVSARKAGKARVERHILETGSDARDQALPADYSAGRSRQRLFEVQR